MAEIENGGSGIPCVPPCGKGSQHEVAALNLIIYIVQLYKEDNTMLHICWAVTV